MFQQLENRFAGALDANKEREKNDCPTSKLEITLPEPTQPHIPLQCYFLSEIPKKGKDFSRYDEASQQLVHR
jgi:hypothetical protein